jgi:hypothetical protein
MVHDLTARSPSITTTQTPQLDESQPICVPVKPRLSRRKYASSVRGSTSRTYFVPLTVTVIVIV